MTCPCILCKLKYFSKKNKLLNDNDVPFVGIVNRGDSFRKRRSRSNSLAREDDPKECTPPTQYDNNSQQMQQQQQVQHQQEQQHRQDECSDDISSYTVSLIGSRGVGKTTLISQFMTSEYINAYERQRGWSSFSLIIY